MPVAAVAGKSQVLGRVASAVLLGHDVFDVVREA